MNKGMEGYPLMMSPARRDKDATSLSIAVTTRHFLSPKRHYAPADVIPPLPHSYLWSEEEEKTSRLPLKGMNLAEGWKNLP